MTGTCCGSSTQHCVLCSPLREQQTQALREKLWRKGVKNKHLSQYAVFFCVRYRERFPSYTLLDQFMLADWYLWVFLCFFLDLFIFGGKSRYILFSSLDVASNILSMRALILDCPVPMPALSVLFITSLASNGLWVCLSNSWSAVSLTCSWERAKTPRK